jgi:bacteriocin-like protein
MRQVSEQAQDTQQSSEPQEQPLKEKELTLEELASVTGGLQEVVIETSAGNKAWLD